MSGFGIVLLTSRFFHIFLLLLILHYLQALGENHEIDNDDHDIRPESDSFLHVYEKFFDVCTHENVCLPKSYDGKTPGAKVTANMHRPWSMSTNKVVYDILRTQASKNCSISELIGNLKETVSVQRKCLSWKTPHEICTTMGLFSMVMFNGDLFVKHLIQGLLMVWTANFRFGGIPRIPEVSSSLYEDCGCDGQFSLSPICNRFNKEYLSFHDSRERGLCSSIPVYHSPQLIFTEVHPNPAETYHTMNLTHALSHLCSPDKRPRFFFLQTGLHRYCKWINYTFIEPTHFPIKLFLLRACPL